MKNPYDTTGNATCDLPACSAVAPPTALPRVPAVSQTTTKTPSPSLMFRHVKFKIPTLTPIKIHTLLANKFRIQPFQNQPSRTQLLYHKSASACTKIPCIFRPKRSTSGEADTTYRWQNGF